MIVHMNIQHVSFVFVYFCRMNQRADAPFLRSVERDEEDACQGLLWMGKRND